MHQPQPAPTRWQAAVAQLRTWRGSAVAARENYRALISAFAPHRAKARVAAALVTAHSLGSILDAVTLAAAFAASGGAAVGLTMAWAGMRGCLVVAETAFRRRLGALAEDAADTVQQRAVAAQLNQDLTQEPAYSGAAFLMDVATIRGAAKNHIPFIGIDLAVFATTGISLAVILSATPWLLPLVPAMGTLGYVMAKKHHHLIQTAAAIAKTRDELQQKLTRDIQFTFDPLALDFLHQSGRITTFIADVSQRVTELNHLTKRFDALRLLSGRNATAAISVLIFSCVMSKALTGVSWLTLPVVLLLLTQAMSAAMRLPDNLLGSQPSVVAAQRLCRHLHLAPAAPAAANVSAEPLDAGIAQRAPTLVVSNACVELSPGVIGVNDVDFGAVAGDVVAITGANGSGKTTLLRAIRGLKPLTTGEIRINGLAVSELCSARVNQLVASAFVDNHLHPSSIFDNVVALNPNATRDQVIAALDTVGLSQWVAHHDGALDCPPGKMSAGERQRLIMARLLVSDRPILLLDEFTTNLDSQGQSVARTFISQAAAEGKIVVVATHDSSIIDMATTQVHLVNRQQVSCIDQSKPRAAEGNNEWAAITATNVVAAAMGKLRKPTNSLLLPRFGWGDRRSQPRHTYTWRAKTDNPALRLRS